MCLLQCQTLEETALRCSCSLVDRHRATGVSAPEIDFAGRDKATAAALAIARTNSTEANEAELGGQGGRRKQMGRVCDKQRSRHGQYAFEAGTRAPCPGGGKLFCAGGAAGALSSKAGDAVAGRGVVCRQREAEPHSPPAAGSHYTSRRKRFRFLRRPPVLAGDGGCVLRR